MAPQDKQMDLLLPDASSSLLFFVNGKRIHEKNVDPEWTLLWYLRNKLGLSGTKLACGEGGCGACTVMLSKADSQGNIRHFSVNGCLYPLASLHGVAVTTIEGLGSCKTKLHPLQERLAQAHGSQCGFCTPGFIMSAYALLRSKPTAPTMEEMEDALVGNLCRCTGYRPILEAFKTFTASAQNGCGRVDCCKNKSNGDAGEQDTVMTDVLWDPSEFSPYDPTQELIFPPELKINPNLSLESLKFVGQRVTFFQVKQLREILEIKSKYPEAKLVVGNTEIGVEVRFKNQLYPVLVNVSGVKELVIFEVEDKGVRVGAAVTLTDLKDDLERVIEAKPKEQTKILASMVEMLRWFAGKQIRNVACLGGNILTCSPISDINPILLAAKATLHFESISGRKRTVKLDSSFFTGYRKCAVLPDEILVSVSIPFTSKAEFFRSYKQARRRDDDIAIVNAAFRVEVGLENAQVIDASFAFGGVAATTIQAEKSAQLLKDTKLSDSQLVEKMSRLLMQEIEVAPSAPGGMTGYRNVLIPSFFFKFFLHLRNELSHLIPGSLKPLEESEQDAVQMFSKPPHKATHFFQKVSPDQALIDPVGRPVAHFTAKEQTTGEAVYIDDMPLFSNELHAALVLSSKAKAKIVSIDTSQALELEGVRLFLSEKDLPDQRNKTAISAYLEDLFARDNVIFVGQIIGAVIADTPEVAERAAKLVKVHYADSGKPIITIEDAIEEKNWAKPNTLWLGDVSKGHAEADHTIEGEYRIGGQEHFYMEPNCCVAKPGENGTMEVYSSTQCLNACQTAVAMALQIPANKVTAKTKRLGGGFGGKETRPSMFSAIAAVAASKTGCPVRLVLDRHTDMLMTAGRNPFIGRWKVSFSKEGQLKAVDVNLFANSGCTEDLSLAVMDRAMFGFDNSYRCDNWRITGHCCFTNLPSNTAYRSFGGPQAIMGMETIIAQIAYTLKKDPTEIRDLNLYNVGDLTPLRMPMDTNSVRECWDKVIIEAEYAKRKTEVEDYNKSHKYKKRGITATPMKFGICFTIDFLNQGGALVMIYFDGSVLVTHGGVEMGQGLHTKTMQVASRVLEVPIDTIHINETSTDKLPNPSPTAASMGSDLYGEAVLRACQKLKDRLIPFKEKNPKGSFEDWVKAAYFAKVELIATGFYGITGTNNFNFETQTGTPFNYFTIGAAVTEVEIDCLTGDHMVLRTDIVMDVGDSLNPAIDIGQIEGAFVQGQGLYTLEELRYSPEGVLLTRGPGMYKMPGVTDIPCELNVTMLRDSPNKKAVYSSRAIGEPPLLLAVSVPLAIREAISAARRNGSSQDDSFFKLDSPVTAERIRMACQDSFTEKVPVHPSGSFRPWDITV